MLAAAQEPYKDARRQRLEYHGPGRDEPEPSGLREVRIGYYGPDDPANPLGGTFWQGAQLAVGEANRSGGYNGLPFRLAARWSENPWTGGAGAVVQMAYTDKVWAIIGGIDGTSTHLAEQVVTKALLPLVDPGSTDKTVNQASVPWMFSWLPADPAHAEAIGRGLRESSTGESFVLISATDHDSRALAAELKGFLARNHLIPGRHVEFQPGALEGARIAAEAAQLKPRAVAVIAGAVDSALVVRELRKAGVREAVFAGPAAGRETFLARAGTAAEEVRFPWLEETPRPELPDYAAASAYDVTALVIRAIRRAGLNRARIRDAIQEMGGWDASGRKARSVRLGVIRGGRRRLLGAG